ncbi:MAG TPA: hypothetical protein VEA78_04270 [Acidimicrobiales bacterium]|nr:hypothetical protein [Acidimicrobiales bacterium]
MTPDVAVAAVSRLTLASLTFAEPAEWWGAALADWVASFEPLADLDGITVTADASLDRLRWRLVGAPEVVVPRAAAWFEHLGLDADAGELMGATGCWLDVSADGLLSGWDLGPERSVLAGGEDGDGEVRHDLAGATLDEQLGAGMALFDELGVEQLPDEVLGRFAATSRPRLLATVARSGGGVSAVALGAVEPTTESVLVVRDAVGVRDDDTLAAFEGALGVTDRVRLEVVQRASGPTARVVYAVA